MKNIHNIVSTLLFTLIFANISAQTGKIEGKVFDAVNNEPLPFVNVIVEGTTIGATTDFDGHFIITGLKPGFVRLSASFIGYQTSISEDIQVTNAKIAYTEIKMQPADAKLEEVVVKASPFKKREEAPVSMNNIGLQEIETNPGSNRDISKVIQSMPGVGSTVSFRNDIIIRGGGPNESRFYIDEVEVPNINHFATQGSSGGPVGIINADFIRSVDFYSGAFPANKGNALSAVFDFSQKEGNKEKLKFRGSIGASEMSLTLDGPMGERSSFIFSARQSYLQFLFDAIGLPFLPTFNDFQLKSRTQIDPKNEITIVGLGAIDKFKLNLGIENPDETQQYILNYLPVNEQWNYALGVVYKHYRDNGYQTVVLSRNMLNNTSYKYPDNNEELQKIQDYKSQEMENKFRFENTYRFGSYKVSYGLNTEYAKYNNDTYRLVYANGDQIDLRYDSDFKMFKWGVYGQASKPFGNLLVSLGVRMDANNYSGSMNNMFEQFSPRLSLSYAITDKVNINANTGRYFQLPAYTTLGYKENGEFINKNNDLKYIQADHLIAGLDYQPTLNTKFSVEGFYKKYSQYPFSVDKQISIANLGGDFGVIGDEEVTSTSEGRAYGAEFLGRVRSGKGFSMIAAYTWVRSEFKDLNGEYKPSSWDNRHIFTITTTKQFKNNWIAGFKWRYLGGLPYTPYDLDLSATKAYWDTKGLPYIDYNRLNEERLNPFHQLDVRVDKKFFFKKWSLMLYVDIQNLYNFKSKNPDYYTTQTNADGEYIFTDETETKYKLKALENISGTVLPTLGIMFEF